MLPYRKRLRVRLSVYLCRERVESHALSRIVHRHVAWMCELLDYPYARGPAHQCELTGRAPSDVCKEDLATA